MSAETSHLAAISAYVPNFVWQQVKNTPDTALLRVGRHLNAALLFADVSGFTTMSENLSRLGKEGSEELTRVLNSYFSTMIELVHSYGGEVVRFSGDAITCIFINPEPDSADLRQEILRAATCARAMQERMVEFQAVETKGETFELQMKIGLGAGKVLSLSLGDRLHGREHILAGSPLAQMVAAEHHAAAGEVLIAPECLANWGQALALAGHPRDKFLRLTQLNHPVSPQPRRALPFPAEKEAARQLEQRLKPYLPPTVYEQIQDGQPQFVGEHRRVASLFVNFRGLDYDHDPDVVEKLQRYYTTMQTLVQRHGGRLNRVSIGDKGSLLHLIFGAPVAHEDNEVRTVNCALALQQEVQGEELSFIAAQKIGIASGYVFAGNVGSEQRREYTVMGDVVNLSARLMQAAAAQEILMDQQTANRVAETISYETLPAIRVKGKAQPVAIFRPLKKRAVTKSWAAAHAELPLVGRQSELAEVDEIIAQARAGHGQLLVLAGEAGVGKSRLLQALVARARDQGLYGLGGNCLSYGSQTPYLPWIDLLLTFFNLNPKEPLTYAAKVTRLEQQLAAADKQFQEWTPLVGQSLGLPIPDNALTSALDAQLRQQRLFDIILTLLRQRAQAEPLLLLIFEDVHWIDSISLELLNYLARNISQHRILLIALHRPTIELTEWKQYPYYHQIELADLPAASALRLAQYKLGLSTIPAPLQAQILHGATHVNPFFVEEVLNSLIDNGYLTPNSEGSGYELTGDLSEMEMPESIQALVMSRIDRLDESSKLTVKVASVIGRTFKYDALQCIYPVEVTPPKLHHNLNHLNQLALTLLDKPAPEWEYLFKHATTQEVAYESLLYAHRRELHQWMGEYLERTHAGNRREVYEILAHHFYQSRDQEKAWTYLLKAGDKAKENYANAVAITHYHRALSLELAAGKPAEAAQTHESLGDIYRLLGEYEPALENYRQALDIQSDATRLANVRRKIAKIWERQGRYAKALNYLELTQETLTGGSSQAELAQLYNDMSWISIQQGNYPESFTLCRQGMQLAEELTVAKESRRIKAELQHTLGSLRLRMGDHQQAITHFQTVIEMRQALGDLHGVSNSYNNLAAVYWNQRKYTLAAEYIHQSLQICRRIGYTYGQAMCYNNLGGTYYVQGDYPRAVGYYEQSLQTRKEIGDLSGLADVYHNLGEVFHSMGEHRKASAYLQEAIQLFSEIGDRAAQVEAYRLLAEIELVLKELEIALKHGQRSLELAQELEQPEYIGVAHRLLGRIQRAASQPAAALRHLRASVQTLSQTNARAELGRSYYELGEFLSAQTAGGHAELQAAVQLFEELALAEELQQAQTALNKLKSGGTNSLTQSVTSI